ncbi:glycine cleavage system protein H [Hydrogenobacter hydrogenophilus]|uniref:Glycine cleavage system H protein n=1 Tax=Hydrogenobacter hydrogenophilus TaxID=35835 RepID=A0A285NXD6_9AQUI|nr:glycine cleavage system protein H [Hydrogenobacter hydrogenophilus]SNZ13583.1 glycine cleavage system H protein [Hydrogenobacter hydrogenophilus]
MISRRDVLKVFLSLSTLSWGKKMEDTVIKGCVIKKDRLYRVDEERMIFQWVKDEGKGVYSVGFMPIMSALAYPLYSVKIKPVGTVLEYDDNLAVVEAGKRVSTFPTPIGGKIVEVNHSLEKDPSALVSSPYEAWMVKIASNDTDSLKKLKKAQDILKTVEAIIIRENIECLPKR